MTLSISLTVNGKAVTADVDPRTLLAQLLRENLHLTGTHIGCDTGQCGACTVHLDGRAVKACNMLAAQAQGAHVTTIEGICKADGELHPMQAAFREHHGLQCGFCTPGMVMNALELVLKHPNPSEATVRARRTTACERSQCRRRPQRLPERPFPVLHLRKLPRVSVCECVSACPHQSLPTSERVRQGSTSATKANTQSATRPAPAAARTACMCQRRVHGGACKDRRAWRYAW